MVSEGAALRASPLWRELHGRELRGLCLTFVLCSLTLTSVIYSQFRVLLTLLIVLGLAGGFLWGGSSLLNSVVGSAPAAPTATVQAVTELPTSIPTESSAHRTAVAQRKATPTPSPTPVPPSPTPNTPPKVFMTNSPDQPLDLASQKNHTFKVNSGHIFCWVNNNDLPAGTTLVTFNWYREQPSQTPSEQFLYSYPYNKYLSYTGTYYSYIENNTGSYRCEVTVDGKTIGSIQFAMQP